MSILVESSIVLIMRLKSDSANGDIGSLSLSPSVPQFSVPSVAGVAGDVFPMGIRGDDEVIDAVRLAGFKRG